MRDKRLIPDSTFFSFFLHNTNEPDFLKKIAKEFHIEIPPKVHSEIQNCQHSCNINSFKDKLHIFDKNMAGFSELLKPLFSTEQKDRGEHDVVVVGFFCYNLRIDFIMVIDDKGARSFVKQNFSCMEKNMQWTANFIKDCFKEYKIFNKEEVLYLLDKMKTSTFRIYEGIVDKLIEEVENE